MSFKRKTSLALIGSALAATSFVASAVTLRVGNQGDALSLDPHSLNESLQLTVVGNIYEPLVTRDRNYKLAPSLATDWKQTSPTVWRFNLRKGVQFHDGTPFTADDVIFSYERAKGDGSDMKSYVGQIKEIRKIDDHTLDFVLNNPFPILPELFTQWHMMSKKWSEANQATKPVDRRKGIENAASFRANGTGPFRVRERQPNVRTTFARNGNYWGKIDGNVEEVIFNVIGNDSTRVAALLSGEIDVMEPVPVQDVPRIKATPNLQVFQGPELRIIFLGMDQKRDELLFSSVKGKNPFKDKRVRQAFYQAIDIEAIKNRVMRGASTPVATLLAPEIRGYAPELAKRLPFDLEAAKKLMADAGYGAGFELKMNCPNDRYVNDGEICQAVAANLSRIGVKINLEAETKGTYFPKVLRRDTSFYMLGWTPSTVDAHNVLYPIMSTPGEGGRGQFNLGAYSNARVDELTNLVASETDDKKRTELIREALKIHQDEVGHLPLHQQAINWAAKKNIELVQWPDNGMPWKFVKLNK
ncbi:MAG: ABC transporter substrate-binding protein [Pseudomonadota bacterium]|uniref:ABC transporter substrate-binding protein n=1 Tax=Polaromonas sp. TaxID=1869339 RepID=UPI0017E90244|nr:ABC transporter substrate-binding protein [Polaromonas sp.]MBA3593074.1 ABC transporter substrate-binding protein [Polaromonas sp.]MDQ3271524.1 ABC transporter substrate-binding protein [Pseudomonadota bacterium]